MTAATERFPVHPADTGPESGNGCKKKTSGTDRATEWSAIALRNNSTGRDPLTPIRRVFQRSTGNSWIPKRPGHRLVCPDDRHIPMKLIFIRIVIRSGSLRVTPDMDLTGLSQRLYQRGFSRSVFAHKQRHRRIEHQPFCCPEQRQMKRIVVFCRIFTRMKHRPGQMHVLSPIQTIIWKLYTPTFT